AVRPARRDSGDSVATRGVEAGHRNGRRDPRRHRAARRSWRWARAAAHRDCGERRDPQTFEWQHRGTMISVVARSGYQLITQVFKQRESVPRQIPIVVLAGLSSCSGPASAPTIRDPSKTTELGIFMKTRVNPSFSKI